PIAGVGLIGRSLAAAARAAGLAGEVVGFGRTEANLRLAHERGLADRVTRDPAAAVAGADAIVLAAPVGACAALAAAFRPHARADALLTDVGSVKRMLVEELEAAWAGAGPVVGAHPIAGSEASGAGAARADLFRGRRCILTPTPATDRAALARVRALWEGVGARVEEMPPAVHDELLARVSHLPHLLAYALVAAVGDKSIAHRALLLGALAEGTTTVSGFPGGADVLSSLGAIEALGARIERAGDAVRIEGAGSRLGGGGRVVIDCGNSGTTMRLTAGLVAGGPGTVVLDGDGSLRRRPMERVAAPLRAMGATVETTAGHAPVTVRGAA